MTYTPPFADIEAWPPTRHTKPLSPDFPSAFDPYMRVFSLVWRTAFGYDLEEWQVQLLRAILEIFPDGHKRVGQLRYRQVVISLGRQNGKTEIAAALGLWQLLAKVGALVISIAHSREQATLVYGRTMQAISRNKSLAKRFAALTDTRGIRARGGGRYEMKASRSAALQGLPIDLGLVDELHLLKRFVWADLVNGTGGRADCIVVGITTAGDNDSELLLDLYALAGEAVKEDATRFGAFIWEAPEARVPEDDNTLGRYLAMANPSVASGRLDLENVISDVRSMPEPDVIRYRLNRFLTSSVAAFMSLADWQSRTRPAEYEWPTTGPLVFTFDRTPEWSYATVTASVRAADGKIHTEVVASLTHPTLETLVEVAMKLWAHGPAMFAMDGYALKQLGAELKRRGMPVWLGSQAEAISASQTLFAKVKQGGIVHAGDPLLSRQVPQTTRKNINDSFRISRADSSVEIDAVLATALGVYVAEAVPDLPLQVF